MFIKSIVLKCEMISFKSGDLVSSLTNVTPDILNGQIEACTSLCFSFRKSLENRPFELLSFIGLFEKVYRIPHNFSKAMQTFPQTPDALSGYSEIEIVSST